MTELVTREKPALPLEAQNGNGSQSLPSEFAMYVQVIERAAANPEVDVAKLEKLMELQERILNRSAEIQFNQAMAKAQSEMKQVAARAMNPQTHSKYANYEALDKMVRPIYTANGFALSFNTGDGAPPEHIRVLCDVTHVAGFSKQYRVDMPADGKGAKGGDVMTKTHAAGAAFTYAARYLLKMVWNIAVGEGDTDGNKPHEVITAEQVAELQKLATETGSSIPKLCKYYQIDKIENLPASLYESSVTAFKKHGQEKAAKCEATGKNPNPRELLKPAPSGQAIDKPTIKVITSKMELAALSTGDFKKRFGVTVDQVHAKDIQTVLAWIIDPMKA